MAIQQCTLAQLLYHHYGVLHKSLWKREIAHRKWEIVHQKWESGRKSQNLGDLQLNWETWNLYCPSVRPHAVAHLMKPGFLYTQSVPLLLYLQQIFPQNCLFLYDSVSCVPSFWLWFFFSSLCFQCTENSIALRFFLSKWCLNAPLFVEVTVVWHDLFEYYLRGGNFKELEITV